MSEEQRKETTGTQIASQFASYFQGWAKEGLVLRHLANAIAREVEFYRSAMGALSYDND